MMVLFIFTATAVSAALTGRYVGFNTVPPPKGAMLPGTGKPETIAVGMTFYPEKSTAHIESPIPAFAIHSKETACREVPYTLDDDKITFKPTAACYAEARKAANTDLFLKTWMTMYKISYDKALDEITMIVPGKFWGTPDDMTWTLPKAPKLAGAVFKGDQVLDGSRITATMTFNKDGTLAFSIPSMPMNCLHEPYLADSKGDFYMALADIKQANGKPLYNMAVDCVGDAFWNNGVFMQSMKFDKEFTKITLKGFIAPDSSSSSSSSSDSSEAGNNSKAEVASSDSEPSNGQPIDFLYVLNREATPKSVFENFWAKALHFNL